MAERLRYLVHFKLCLLNKAEYSFLLRGFICTFWPFTHTNAFREWKLSHQGLHWCLYVSYFRQTLKNWKLSLCSLKHVTGLYRLFFLNLKMPIRTRLQKDSTAMCKSLKHKWGSESWENSKLKCEELVWKTSDEVKQRFISVLAISEHPNVILMLVLKK